MLSGGEPLLLFSPDHARVVARQKSRAAARAFLYETARLPLSMLPPETQAHLRERTVKAEGEAEEALRVAAHAADIILVVVGGTGFKSTYVPTWGGGTRAVSRLIDTSQAT